MVDFVVSYKIQKTRCHIFVLKAIPAFGWYIKLKLYVFLMIPTGLSEISDLLAFGHESRKLEILLNFSKIKT